MNSVQEIKSESTYLRHINEWRSKDKKFESTYLRHINEWRVMSMNGPRPCQ
jgi:hypothetical protein